MVYGVTTVYQGGIWEEEIQTGVTRSHYSLDGNLVAPRTSSPNQVLYVHGDHLGSGSALTDQNQLVVSKQNFTAWGEIRGGGSGSPLYDHECSRCTPLRESRWWIRNKRKSRIEACGGCARSASVVLSSFYGAIV